MLLVGPDRGFVPDWGFDNVLMSVETGDITIATVTRAKATGRGIVFAGASHAADARQLVQATTSGQNPHSLLYWKIRNPM